MNKLMLIISLILTSCAVEKTCHIQNGTMYCPNGSTADLTPKDGKEGDEGKTGKRGPKGEIGSTGGVGNTGSTGPQGNPGIDGFSTYVEAGTPSSLLGKNGDSYFDSLTANFYKKVSNAWVLIINLTGPVGPQGPQGLPGNYNGCNGTGTTGIVLQPNCSGCSNMVLVPLTQQTSIGGQSDYNTTFDNLNSICQSYGYCAPTTSSNSSGTKWDHNQSPYNPATSDQWNPTYPWMTGAIPSGFSGGRVYIASGDPYWLSVAVYPYVSPGDNLYTNSGSIQYESYHPQSGGNWSQINQATMQAGEYVMCAQ